MRFLPILCVTALAACQTTTAPPPSSTPAGLEQTEEATATVHPGPGGDRTALRAQLQIELSRFFFPTYVADDMADACPGYTFNRGRQSWDLEKFADRMVERGYSLSDVHWVVRSPDPSEVRRLMLEYGRENGIDPDRPETFCRAADREMAKGSRIARYLKRS